MRKTLLLFSILQSSVWANEEIAVDLIGGATMEVVWIEPGTFMMGSPNSEEGRDVAEGPQHQVTISQGFYLGKVEITQGQWEAVMGTKPWQGKSSVIDNPLHPAVYISWNDLQTFIQLLNDAAGEAIYRLPTEAEWEYVARPGTTTRWSFGGDENQLGDYAWYVGNNSPNSTKEVGQKSPNAWGLYDMHGNVWEWVQDWYGDYDSDSVFDPTGPSGGAFRCLRGGSFGSAGRHLRAADRGGRERSRRDRYIGARLLRTGPDPTAVMPQRWGQIKERIR